MASHYLPGHVMNDGEGSKVSQERRRSERVQDAVGLKIIRLQDQPAAGDSNNAQRISTTIDDRPTHKISLSAVGIAFAHDDLMRPGELISVQITLFPSCHIIQVDGRVVSANDAAEIADGDKPTYRVAFESISDSDRELIEVQVKTLAEQRPAME